MSAGSPPFPVTGCFLPAVNDSGAGLAVFCPVGTGKKGLSADSAPFMFFPMKQSSHHRFIQRQDSGTEPVAQQRVGNALHANAFFSIVKGKAVPALIVAALMDQLSSSAVLGVGHHGDFLFDFYHLLLDGQNTLFYLSVHFDSKMTPPFENKFEIAQNPSHISVYFRGNYCVDKHKNTLLIVISF